jgi:nucleotide-binding universal stress UspA family protein
VQVGRVIVGVSGSAGSLQALRYASGMAAEHHAMLVPVLAWTPPGGEIADRRCPNAVLRAAWQQAAWDRLWSCIELAIGGPPAGPMSFAPEVVRGAAGEVLTQFAAMPGDALVIGAGRRGSLRRLAGGGVTRYCVGHAGCPVIAVPPARLATEAHGLHGWMLRHRLHAGAPGLGAPGIS